MPQENKPAIEIKTPKLFYEGVLMLLHKHGREALKILQSVAASKHAASAAAEAFNPLQQLEQLEWRMAAAAARQAAVAYTAHSAGAELPSPVTPSSAHLAAIRSTPAAGTVGWVEDSEKACEPQQSVDIAMKLGGLVASIHKVTGGDELGLIPALIIMLPMP